MVDQGSTLSLGDAYDCSNRPISSPDVAARMTAAGVGQPQRRNVRGLLRAVRPEGANHLWRRVPSGELSIDMEADERLAEVTEQVGAS
jgi:hypothetical protein